MINVFEPTFHIDAQIFFTELLEVEKSLDNNWTGRGPRALEFEAAFADYANLPAEQLLSITSCTDGLFMAIQALEIGPGDEVIVPDIHFIGAANAVMAAGARLVLCDVNPHSLNTDVSHIVAHVTKRTRAIILLHYGGIICEDIEEIVTLCKNNNIYLIEDCACSMGAIHGEKDKRVFGDIAVWSFDSMKMITTGDGGMIYAEDELIDKIYQLAYLGMDSGSGMSSNNRCWWEFNVSLPGGRHLMNDIAASIGLVQLQNICELRRGRYRVVDIYDQMLEGIDKPRPRGGSPYFYWIQTDRRNELAYILRDRYEIYTTFRYYPLHSALGWHGSYYPLANYAAARTLLLPLHANLDRQDAYYIANSVNEAVEELARA